MLYITNFQLLQFSALGCHFGEYFIKKAIQVEHANIGRRALSLLELLKYQNSKIYKTYLSTIRLLYVQHLDKSNKA